MFKISSKSQRLSTPRDQLSLLAMLIYGINIIARNILPLSPFLFSSPGFPPYFDYEIIQGVRSQPTGAEV